MRKLLTLLLLAPCALLAQVPDYVPTDGLIAWYPMNGNALDGSGNAHHGTVTGAALILDRNGTTDAAYSFAGNCSDRIDMDLPEMVDNTTFSISFWAKRNGSGCQNPRLWEFYNGDYTTQCGWFNSWDYITFSGVSINTSLNDGEWVHFTLTEDGQDWRTYVNGELTNTYAKTFVTNSPDFAIGRMNHSAWDSFNGDLDDFAIYNRVLTDEEVTSLYQSSSPEEPCFDFSEVPGEVYVDNGPVILQLGPGESSPQADSNGLVVISEPGLFVLERYMGDAHLSLIQDSSWVDFGDILNGLTPPVSFSFDVRLSGNGGPILATDNGNPSHYNGYWISLTNSQLDCNYGDGGWHGGGERRTGRVYSDFAQNEWYHITCVVNGANDFAFYLDGVEQTTSYNDAGFGGGVNFTSDPMKLGHHNAASPGTGAVYDQCFAGDLNNVTVWHRALNGAEAAALQEGGLPEDLTALVAHWDFNGTSGGVVVDGSGLGHDGQLIGNATIITTPQCTTTDTIVVHHSGCTDEAACNYDSTATEDDNSCSFSPVPALPTDSSTSESTLLLNAGPDFGAYLWSTGETGETITVTESGQYSVQAMQHGSVNRSVHFDAPSIEQADFSAVTSAFGNEGTIAIDFKIETPESITPDLGGTWNVTSYPLFFMDNGTEDPLVIRIGRGCYAPASSISLEDDDCGQSNPNVRASWGTDPLHFFDGEWHRIALSSGAEGHALYVDGTLLSLAYSLGGPSINVWPEDANAFSLARELNANWDFVGELDNLIVWSSPLTSNQVSSLDPCQVNPTSPDLLGFWPFDEGDSAVALDVSGNDHHGMLDANRTLQPAQTACSPCFAESTVMVHLLIANCTDSLACNYNVMAILDDGSCDYSCCPGPGCCSDGTVWDTELHQCVTQSSPCDTVYLSVPSCGPGTVWDPINEMCIVAIPADLNFDGCVTVGDLLELLAVHGTCPPYPEWPDFPGDTSTTGWSCGNPLPYQGYDYATVQIGDQCWFAESLQATETLDGADLEAGTPGNWPDFQDGTGAWMHPENDPSLSHYGLLYNWHATAQGEGMCPSGWHLPSDEEWKELEVQLDIDAAELDSFGWHGTIQGAELKSSAEWNGTNTHYFGAVPSGGVHADQGYVSSYGSEVWFWTSSTLSTDEGKALFRSLSSGESRIQRHHTFKNHGGSIRCLKD